MVGKNAEFMIDMLHGITGAWCGYKNPKNVKDTDRYNIEYKATNSPFTRRVLPYSVKKESVITIEMTGEYQGQFCRYHFVFPDENRDDINFEDSLILALSGKMKFDLATSKRHIAELKEENFMLNEKIIKLKGSKFQRETTNKRCHNCDSEMTVSELKETKGKCITCGTQILKN